MKIDYNFYEEEISYLVEADQAPVRGLSAKVKKYNLCDNPGILFDFWPSSFNESRFYMKYFTSLEEYDVPSFKYEKDGIEYLDSVAIATDICKRIETEFKYRGFLRE